MKLNRRLLTIIGGAVFAITFVGLVITLLLSPGSGNLELLVAPSPATLTLDGKTVKSGKHNVSTGKHTITASMSGFAKQTRTVTIGNDPVTIRFILLTNSAEGEKYLDDHPEEGYLMEAYDGQNFNDENARSTANNPIIKDLPYVDSSNRFRIDIGAVTEEDPKAPIYITGIDLTAVQAAKNWITNAGYNLKTLDIKESIEPLLDKLPYKTTDFTINPDFATAADGTLKMNLSITIILSGADTGNDAAVTAYKQSALNSLRSLGANPDSYTITYIVP